MLRSALWTRQRSRDTLTESKTKMKVVTWQLLEGDTQTAPLLSYNDGKDLGMSILVGNLMSDCHITQ